MVNSDDTATTGIAADTSTTGMFLKAKVEILSATLDNVGNAVETTKPLFGTGTAFIGGGCCVHLSVEYIANNPAKASAVEIVVVDSEGTGLGWGRVELAGTPYRIKEGIITTKPGAKLIVVVFNATVRVRWCEIFSC